MWKLRAMAAVLSMAFVGGCEKPPAPATTSRPATTTVAPAATTASAEAALAAEETARMTGVLSGWKVRAYRTGRTVALRGVLEGLAVAAEQAEKARGATTLPDALAATASLAADVDRILTGRGPRPDGTPDFPAIARDLHAASASPPAHIGAALTIGYLFSGRDDFALVEASMLDPAAPGLPADGVPWVRVLRAATFRAHNMHALARAEMAAIPADSLAGRHGAELQSGFYLYSALQHVQDRNFAAADVEIVRAMKAWPNNPASVFLTGERLAADGKTEEAADSLEKAAKGTKSETLARLIAARARTLRDEKAAARPLLADRAFLRELSTAYAAEAALSAAGATTSASSSTAPATTPAAAAASWLETGKNLTQKMLSAVGM